MLVLTRRVGETIVIDGDISITVVAVKGDRVRLGATAPRAVQVDRQEVHRRRVEFMDCRGGFTHNNSRCSHASPNS